LLTNVGLNCQAANITTIATTSIQLLLHGCCYALDWPELGELGAHLLDEEEA
jgi:hypothetical protein